MPIAIIGLGYVGLPLALAFAEAGDDVIGLDTDPAKVEAINAPTAESDLAAIVTAHPEVDYERLVANAKLVLDLRGVTRGIDGDNVVRL